VNSIKTITAIKIMMFKSTLFASLLVAASAEISSTSNAGAKILSKARALNDNYEDDFSWMASYDLKFDGCHTIHTYGGEGQGGEEGSSPFGIQHLAKFKLCAAGKNGNCGSCSKAGVYMVELRDFAEAYLTAEQESQEAACATVEENCNCDYYYGDDQACLSQCYSSAGLSFCGEDENAYDFDPAEYLECAEAPFNNNNNGYYSGNTVYYIGPKCSGTGVTLGVFTDAQCTVKAASNTFEKYMYGMSLPYSKSSMLSTKCVSCKADNDNDNNANGYYNANAYYQAEPSDTCTGLYEQSAKCEKNMSGKNQYTRDTGSCDYIHKIVPALESVYHSNGGGASTGFAVFFAFTTVAAAAAAYFFYSKVERTTVGLSSQDGALA